MKFIIKKHDELSTRLNLNLKATSPNSVIEAFKHLKLKTIGNTLEITSYNNESCVISTVSIENVDNKECEFLVDANIFKNVIDKLIELSASEIEIFLDFEKERMTISYKGIKFKLKILKDTKDFLNAPSLDSYNDYKTAIFNTNALRRAFLNTKKCTIKDQARPILEAINIIVDNDKADIFAIDGYKLALNKLDCECSDSFKTSLSSSSAISILTDVLKNGFDFVEFNSNGTYTMVENDNLVVFFREIAGNVIDYHRLIKKSDETINIKVNKKVLTSAITATKIGNNSNAPVRLRFNPIEKQIIFSVAKTSAYNGSVDNCEIPVDIEVETDSTEILDIHLNSVFLIELLGSIYTENCNLTIQTSTTPLFLENDNDNNSIYLLLPVRVGK